MNIDRIKKYDVFFTGLHVQKSSIIDFPVLVGSMQWFILLLSFATIATVPLMITSFCKKMYLKQVI